MAITVTRSQTYVHPGPTGYVEVRGLATFSTTDTSGEIPVKGMKLVDNVQLTNVTDSEADEILFVSETISSGGLITVPSTNSITIGRSAGTTSGLQFFFRITGY